MLRGAWCKSYECCELFRDSREVGKRGDKWLFDLPQNYLVNTWLDALHGLLMPLFCVSNYLHNICLLYCISFYLVVLNASRLIPSLQLDSWYIHADQICSTHTEGALGFRWQFTQWLQSRWGKTPTCKWMYSLSLLVGDRCCHRERGWRGHLIKYYSRCVGGHMENLDVTNVRSNEVTKDGYKGSACQMGQLGLR